MKKNRLRIKVSGKQYARPFYIGVRAGQLKHLKIPVPGILCLPLAMSVIRSGKPLHKLATGLSNHADYLDRKLSDFDFHQEYLQELIPDLDFFDLERKMRCSLPDPNTYDKDRYRFVELGPLPAIASTFDPKGHVTIQDHFFRKVKTGITLTGQFVYSWEKE